MPASVAEHWDSIGNENCCSTSDKISFPYEPLQMNSRNCAMTAFESKAPFN